MYSRHTTRLKESKAHTYWPLVRSVRRGSKVVQETVAQLEELDAEGRAKAKALARSITGGRNGEQQGELFEVKICAGPNGSEAFVLCRSTERATKEKAMHERFSKRIQEALAKWAGASRKVASAWMDEHWNVRSDAYSSATHVPRGVT